MDKNVNYLIFVHGSPFFLFVILASCIVLHLLLL